MPTNFDLPFVLSVMGAFIVSYVVANLYVWPALRLLPRANALRILASFHAFRFLGDELYGGWIRISRTQLCGR